MPLNYSWEKMGVIVRWMGDVTPAEIFRMTAAITSDDRFRSLTYLIHDQSALAPARYSLADIEDSIALRLGSAYSNPGLHIAHVAPNEAARLFFEQLRQDNLLSDNHRCFDTMAQAQDWIQCAAL